MEKKYNKKNTAGHIVMTEATHKHQRHAQEQCLGEKMMICDATQWKHQIPIRHVYVIKDER